MVWFLLSVLLGWSLVLFKTGSMAPTYPTGAAGISVPVTAEQIETGDVVTVPRAEGGLPVTHRVVSVEDPGAGDGARELVLQGDANPDPDREVYTVTEADKVVVGAPYVGYAVTVLAQPKTLAILTAAMAALTVWVFWPRAGDDDEDDEDDEEAAERSGAAGPDEDAASDERAAERGGERVVVSAAGDGRPTRAALREQERQRHGRRAGPGRQCPP
jgi:signal peptidase